MTSNSSGFRDGFDDEPISVIGARDAVLECFTETHGPRFARVRMELGQDANQAAVRESVRNLLRVAFQQAGGSYEHPTREHLLQVVNILAERSLEWGTAEDVVFEHHAAVTRLLGRVRGS